MKFEELKTGRKCIEVKSKKELMQIRSYCVYKKLKLDFEVSDFNVEDGHNLFVIFENNLACLFWDKFSGDRQKFDISDIDEFNGNFTKADLKDGMIVENRAGKRRLVIGEKLTGQDGFSIIANYKENLNSKHREELDIVKIYKSQYVTIISDIFNNHNLELIWERKENTPPKWTEWKPVEYCELFEFKQKDSKIEVRRPSVKGITVSSTCLSTDIFNLKYGQELCIKKWNIEYAKKQLDDFIKEN